MNAQQLSLATGARIDRALDWLPHIEAAMAEFGIDTPGRQAMFLAQVGHESAGLRYTTELWGPTPAQVRYEVRHDLGNTQRGDGFKYRGRGLLQVTGRANYAAVGQALGLDLVEHPEQLADYGPAARSACVFWKAHHLNDFADRADVKGCTHVINGGENGLAERTALYLAAMAALA